MSKVGVDGECVVSTYAIGSHGYAMIGWYESGVQYNGLVHRIAWASQNGPIPEGLVVHHECFNRKCINVEHMRLTEMWQNTRRTGGQDWPEGTCKYGHSDENMTYIESEKKRRCIVCYKAQRKERTRRAAEKRRAARCN